MSIEGQCHFFTICFPGFVCFVLYLAKISGERLQDHWSSGLQYFICNSLTVEWMQDFMNATVFIYFLLCICTSEYKRFLPVHNTISILIHK